MVLYANGDRQAALALTRRVTPRVMAYAARHAGRATGPRPRMWRRKPCCGSGGWRPTGGRARRKVTTWAYRVATNLCIDRQRARSRKRQVALDDAPEVADGAPGAEGRLQEARRMAALEAALAELPDRQRQAVVLRHIEGLTNPEIAAMHGDRGRSGGKPDGTRQAGAVGFAGGPEGRAWDMRMTHDAG